MKILIVDDHPLYIDGLATILKSEWREIQIYEAATAAQALTIVESTELSCILIDYRLPDMDGLDLLKSLLARNINLTAAIISGDDDPHIAKSALDLGARGFLPKSLKTKVLINAVKTMIAGKEFLSDDMREHVEQLNRQEFNNLAKQGESMMLGVTPRQLEVLKLMAKGHSNKQISNIMHLSTNTVKEHIHNLFRSLQVKNRSQCIVKAQELGLDVTKKI